MSNFKQYQKLMKIIIIILGAVSAGLVLLFNFLYNHGMKVLLGVDSRMFSHLSMIGILLAGGFYNLVIYRNCKDYDKKKNYTVSMGLMFGSSLLLLLAWIWRYLSVI